MKLLVCKTTHINATLIYFTEKFISDACSFLFKDTKSYQLNSFLVDDHSRRRTFDEIVEAAQTKKDIMVLFTAPRNTMGLSEVLLGSQNITYLSDAPFSYTDCFNAIPPWSTVTYTDRNMKQFYDDFNINLNRYFMPHGGPNNILSDKDVSERTYPISFVGRIANPEPEGGFWKIAEGGPSEMVMLVKEVVERCYYEGEEAYISYRKSCIDRGFDPLNTFNANSLFLLLKKMQVWLEYSKRIKFLQSLKGMPIHFFGDIADEVKEKLDPGFTYHGVVNGLQALEVMADTQISLNPVSVFPAGSHERVWFAMATKSVVYSDYSSFMSETLTDNESILFHDYQDEDKAADRLQTLLNSPDDIQQIADNAVPIYEKNHTWIKRLENLFKQMPETKEYMV